MTADLQTLLVLTPHSSGALPADVLLDMLGPAAFESQLREAFLRRIFLDGDPYTDLIYALSGAHHVQAPWSRFAADLNRERDDTDDNGVLKMMGFDRGALYPPGFRLSAEQRETRLRRLWDPFDAQVQAELAGTRLMIVGHAMAPSGPALGPDTGTPRPALCLMPGTPEHPTFPVDRWPALQAACEEAFAGVLSSSPDPRVTIGEPWTTDTLSQRHHRRSGVPAFGIEVNAGLYLSEGEPIEGTLRGLNAAFGHFAAHALTLV
ncbi:N-formylglutamate amidohydrolase [Deinococcus navajonensis]|uniref:N-formylglutamate amidohydrolase n=1 Tax=Deinococcus navajonensis TaxID=309884 RepID=A0ABV8XMC5_9DEIO